VIATNSENADLLIHAACSRGGSESIAVEMRFHEAASRDWPERVEIGRRVADLV
jgi:hypothetical protein